MENLRRGYGFSREARQYAHDRAGLGLETGELAGGKCEFPGEECFNKPEPFVAHITGCLEARLEGMTKESISDITENGLMQCKKHNEFHDLQEKKHIKVLRQEVIFDRKWEKPRVKRARPTNRRRPFRRRR